MMRVHMISISCLHVHIPCRRERSQSVHVCKTLVMPVPREPSVIENMPFLYIFNKDQSAYQAKSLFTICC